MAVLKAHNSILKANGKVLVKNSINSINFDYISDAPSFTGSFNNITYNGSKLSKVTSGTTRAYFTSDKSSLPVTKFKLSFKRLVYNFTGVGANNIAIEVPGEIIFERAHHYYNNNYRQKKQICIDYNCTLFNGAYLTSGDVGWGTGHIVIIDQPFYNVVDEFVIEYDGSTMKFFCNGTLYASFSRRITQISCLRIVNEVGTNGCAVGEIKLEYI